jgi:hypothetical protein
MIFTTTPVKALFIDKYVHITPIFEISNISQVGPRFLFGLEPYLQICNYESTHASVKLEYSPLNHKATCLCESQKI